MEELSPQFHDSLDLTELKQEGKAAKALFEKGRRVSQYARIFLGIALGFGIFFRFLLTISAPSLSERLGILALIALLVTTGVIAATVMLVISYRQYARYIHRVNTFALSFVPRTQKIYFRFFRPTTILVYGLFILAVLLLDSNLIRFGLIIVLYIYVILYRRFLAWVLKGGVPRIEKTLHYLPNNPILMDIKISLLINTGRTEEAERLSHDVLLRADAVNLPRAGYRLKKVGFGLTMVGQYEKALPFLEATIQMLPADTDAYDKLALWYLEQNYEPERALELTEIALDFAVPELGDLRVLHQANNARALALTGQESRAESGLKTALKHSSKLPPPAMAEVNRQAGHVRLVQNNREEAIEHFQKAVELDPNGIYGKLAQKAIDSLAPPS